MKSVQRLFSKKKLVFKNKNNRTVYMKKKFEVVYVYYLNFEMISSD